MLTILARQRAVCLLLAVLLVVQGSPIIARAQGENTIGIDNVRFEITGDLVRVYYDLSGPPDRVHSVQLTLRRESDPTFIYRPINLTGEVGTVVFPGQKRRITWDFTKEFPDGLSGSDYYFVVDVELVEPEGTNSLIWWGGGAAVAVSIVAVILLSKKAGDTPPPPPPAEFPAPPGRPQ